MGNPVYIVTPDGRDEGTTNEGFPDHAMWHHPGRPSARRFDAPILRSIHSSQSAPTDLSQWPHATWHRGRDVSYLRRGGGNDGSPSRWNETSDTDGTGHLTPTRCLAPTGHLTSMRCLAPTGHLTPTVHLMLANRPAFTTRLTSCQPTVRSKLDTQRIHSFSPDATAQTKTSASAPSDSGVEGGNCCGIPTDPAHADL